MLAGAKVCCHNQSSPYWVTAGLCLHHQKVILEVCGYTDNCHFERPWHLYCRDSGGGDITLTGDLYGRYDTTRRNINAVVKGSWRPLRASCPTERSSTYTTFLGERAGEPDPPGLVRGLDQRTGPSTGSDACTDAYPGTGSERQTAQSLTR